MFVKSTISVAWKAVGDENQSPKRSKFVDGDNSRVRVRHEKETNLRLEGADTQEVKWVEPTEGKFTFTVFCKVLVAQNS